MQTYKALRDANPMADHFRESIAEPIVARECTGRPPSTNVVSGPELCHRSGEIAQVTSTIFRKLPSNGPRPSIDSRCLGKIPRRRSRTTGITSPIRVNYRDFFLLLSFPIYFYFTFHLVLLPSIIAR